MKHQHVEATLVYGAGRLTSEQPVGPAVEPIAPWAVLAPVDPEPMPRPRRTCVEWQGDCWMEWNPATGEIIATGTAGN